MRRFLYYFPGITGMNNGMLSERGLMSRLAQGWSVTACPGGPKGSGCIVAAGNQPAAYEPARQRWAESKKFWVGVEDVDLPPRPQDLVRPVGVKGCEIELAGALWTIPLIRRWDAYLAAHVSALPQSIKCVMVDGKSQAVGGISPEYEPLDLIADGVFANFISNRTIPLTEAFVKAVELLAVNYRIGVEEAGLLGIFDEQTIPLALGVCIDLPAMDAWAAERATEGLQGNDPVIEEED